MPGPGTPRAVGQPRYAGGRLDRASALRENAELIAELSTHPTTRIVPIWNDRNLVVGLDAGDTRGESPRPLPRAGWLRAERYEQIAAHNSASPVLLGMDGDIAFFAADLTDLPEVDGMLRADLEDGASFVDLRQIGSQVAADDAALMAYARGMVTWHRRNGYCGVCGSATENQKAGHMRRCTNQDCRTQVFPRTDPAVIMLVEQPASDRSPAQCLLARRAGLTVRGYSTLAGFVEPGETPEEAVIREVREETGVRVSNVSYRGSQPWPFPAALMIGFRAVAETTEIVVDRTEIEEACWFTAEEISQFGEWGDDSAKFQLSRKDSIGRALVDDWLAESRD